MNVEKRKKWRNYGIIALALGAALFGSFQYISSYSTVSGNINGKEMPICSVEIEEKKVALTFDAAWGNEDSGYPQEAQGSGDLLHDRRLGGKISGGG